MSTAAVNDPIPCVSCGYELQGLRISSPCPECGRAVADSLRDDLLVREDPRWVRRISRGAAFINYGMGAVVLSVLIGIATGLLTSILLGAGTGGRTPSTAFLLLAAASVVSGAAYVGGTILFALGWFFFTAPNPGIADAAAQTRERYTARVSMIVLALLLPAWWLLSSLTAQLAAQAGAYVGYVVVLLGGALLAWHGWLAMNYAAWLAARIPDAKLHRRARRNRVALALWSTAGLLLCGLGPLIGLALYYNAFVRLRRALRGVVARVNAGPEPSPASPPAVSA